MFSLISVLLADCRALFGWWNGCSINVYTAGAENALYSYMCYICPRLTLYQLHIYAFSRYETELLVLCSSAACMTWELADSGNDFIVTVINGADLVPTFSAASVDDLRAEV